MNEVFEILSLFTGGGFLDIGFFNNGFQIREAIEIEKTFIKGHNFGLQSYFEHSKNYYIKNKLVVNIPIDRAIDASDDDEICRLGMAYHNISGVIGVLLVKNILQEGKMPELRVIEVDLFSVIIK